MNHYVVTSCLLWFFFTSFRTTRKTQKTNQATLETAGKIRKFKDN